MVGCSIRNCKSRNIKGGTIMFFRFPTKESVAKEWLRYCGPKTTTKNGRVCSIHFLSSDYRRSLQHILLNESPRKVRKLKPDALPTLQIDDIYAQNMPSTSIEVTVEPIGNTGNITCSDECNTAPAEIAGPSNAVEKSDESITISLAEHKQLQKTAKNCHVLKNNLENIFTSGQMSCLLEPDMRRARWSAEDIAAAISLRSISRNGYRHLRNTVGIPLPALSTLRKWASKEGLLDDVVNLMKIKAKSFNALDKLVTLAFKEIYLQNKIEIDKKDEQKVEPQNDCQCVMARSLCGKWKQPIYFECDQKMIKDILLNIIKKMYDAGLTVVSVTCDMRPVNQGLIRSLNVSIENGQQSYFDHPGNSDLKVHVFFDVPHLLILARNHFIDHGFVYNNKLLTKKTIEKILGLTDKDLKITHKITSCHLNVEGSQRKKVRPAAQLFSNKMAQAIERCGIKDLLQDENWLEMSYIFKVFNDWFDVFNARMKLEGNKNAYGLELDAQNLVLDRMNHLMQNIKTGKINNNMTPFQRGVLITNKSLVNLFDNLKGRVDLNLEYILTSRLHQDV